MMLGGNCMKKSSDRPTRQEIIKRLSRLEGQVRGIKQMIENEFLIMLRC